MVSSHLELFSRKMSRNGNAAGFYVLESVTWTLAWWEETESKSIHIRTNELNLYIYIYYIIYIYIYIYKLCQRKYFRENISEKYFRENINQLFNVSLDSMDILIRNYPNRRLNVKFIIYVYIYKWAFAEQNIIKKKEN